MDDELRCPRCGCNHLLARPARNQWGKPGYLCECQFCAARFQIEDPDADVGVAYSVPFVPLRCPHCNGIDNEVTSTRRKSGIPTTRYHRCREAGCGRAFKSTESTG